MSSSTSKVVVRRALEMQTVGLVSWKHIQPWAASQIAALPKPSAWLCELVSLTYCGDVDRCLREFVFSPPFEAFDESALCDYAVACLFMRYRRRDLSWASFLRDAGQLVDARNVGCEPCEFYFALLNEYEDDEFNLGIEKRQVQEVSDLLAESVALVTQDLGPYLRAFREGLLSRRSN